MTRSPDEPEYEPIYRAVIPEDTHPELMEEEFELFQRMMDRLGRDRIPENSTGAESKAILQEAMSEDPALAAIAKRLDEVIRFHRGSIIRKLMEAEEAEES